MWPLGLLGLLSKLPGIATQVFTGINFNQVFAAIGNFLGLAFTNIQKYWRFYLPVLMAVIMIGEGFGWSHEHTLLVKERTAHQQDITNFKKAQADANANAQAEKVILQKESKANADQADAKYSTLLAQYHANLLRYKASQGGTGQASNSELSPTQSGDGPSTGSELSAAVGGNSSGSLVISEGDAQICAVNTARLQAVHDWALNPPKDGTD